MSMLSTQAPTWADLHRSIVETYDEHGLQTLGRTVTWRSPNVGSDAMPAHVERYDALDDVDHHVDVGTLEGCISLPSAPRNPIIIANAAEARHLAITAAALAEVFALAEEAEKS